MIQFYFQFSFFCYLLAFKWKCQHQLNYARNEKHSIFVSYTYRRPAMAGDMNGASRKRFRMQTLESFVAVFPIINHRQGPKAVSVARRVIYASSLMPAYIISGAGTWS